VQFADKGYPVMELEGGFAVWKEHDLELEETSTNRLKQQSGSRMAGRG
jgi:hypothetical protein